MLSAVLLPSQIVWHPTDRSPGTNNAYCWGAKIFFWLRWGLTTRQPSWVILCPLPEKGRKEIEEIVEEMKKTNREERWTRMKVKKQKK